MMRSFRDVDLAQERLKTRLAAGLLQIAKQAMPDHCFANDSRCELAREALRGVGIDPDTIGEMAEAS